MAAIDRAFSAIPFFRMEYHQPGSFPPIANTSAIVNSPFCEASGNPLYQTNCNPIGGVINNSSCFTRHSPFILSPAAGGDGMGTPLPNVLSMHNPDKTHGIPHTGHSIRMKKKHRHDLDVSDCPSKRRKLCVSPVLEEHHAPTTYTGDALQPCWNAHSSPAAVSSPLCAPSSEMQTALTEDMEEVPVESHADAALRRIRDIESRLVIEEEEDDEEENKNDRLPMLVMSDVLVESLKKGLDESLTKKIVDSMNRPSMEIVLWKPQPELLIDKLQSFTSNHNGEKRTSKPDTPEMQFLRQMDSLEADEPQTLTLDCDIDPMWGREEEEMEL